MADNTDYETIACTLLAELELAAGTLETIARVTHDPRIHGPAIAGAALAGMAVDWGAAQLME